MEIIFLLLVAVICFGGARLLSGNSSSKTKIYKENYEKSLKQGDRVSALEWGRKYFASLRWMNGYVVTIYDEQRIQNDINVHCK